MIAFSSVAIALVGFMVWAHHMFYVGSGALASVAVYDSHDDRRNPDGY